MKIKKLVAILLLLTVTGFVVYKTTVVRIDIVYTNDLHGRVNVLPRIEYYIKKLNRDKLLLLDAGDFIQGTPESDFFKGESMVELFNLVGYNAVTVGNHEFDFGEDNLVNISKKVKFYLLGSNICDNLYTLKPYITNYMTKTFYDVKIGIFGLLTKQTKFIVIPEHLKNVEFHDEILTAKKVVSELLKDKVDIIICLSHIGFNETYSSDTINDILIAEGCPEINIIIGGHTHRRYEKHIKNTLVVQTGAYGETIGHIKIYIFKPTKTIIGIKNKFVNTRKLKDDKTILEVVNKYTEEVNKIFDYKIGYLENTIEHYRDKESPLGDFICDVMVGVTKADFAVTNSGGIRGSLPKGEIKYRDLYNVLPFDNTIVKTQLLGKDVKSMFEHSVSGKYGILQVSKEVQVVYDLSQPVGSRVKELYIKGEPLKEYRTYYVATNSFLAYGGEGYHWFSKYSVVDTGVKVRDAVRDYLKSYHGTPVVSQSKRIVFLGGQ